MSKQFKKVLEKFVIKPLNKNESVNKAVGPFLPLVASVVNLTKEMSDAYENVQYNKRTCGILVNRIEAAEAAVKGLIRSKEENIDRFFNPNYYNSFQKFITCLEKIKEFFYDISQLPKFEKFLSSDNIRENLEEKFKEIIGEFDSCSKDLSLNIIYTTSSKMNEYLNILNSDLNEIKRFLNKIGSGITSVDDKTEGIAKIQIQNQEIIFNAEEQNKIIDDNEDKNESLKISKDINDIRSLVISQNPNLKANLINPSELKDPPQHNIRKGSRVVIQKKVYQAMDVACKPVSKDNIQKVQNHLAILGKLNSPYIIQFRGLSEICGESVMVLEWAEYGNLRELYLRYNIAWEAKISIARDICRGLAYLHSVSILHHDLKCESILIAERMIPKISNFEFSREFDEATKSIEFNEIIYWLAPEKLKSCIPNGDRKRPEVKYTIQCEIFSFGMLFWELCFHRKPYENMGLLEILNHVVNGGRETLDIESNNPIQKGCFSIIKLAWDQDPSLRPGIPQLFNMLQELYDNHIKKSLMFYPTSRNSFDDSGLEESGDDESEELSEYETIKSDQITDRERFGDKYINNISSATLSTDNSKVVIKEIRYDNSNIKSLKKELNNWIKVYEHPNIIKFSGIYKDDQKLFLTMPLANEGNLGDYLKNKKLPFINEKIEIAINITSGIKYLHENGIIHGNLHSKNILLFNGVAQISDLPLPSIANEAMYFEDKGLFDSIGYIDPDSLLNETFRKNKPMDVYSLGSLLWEIASGKVPFLEDQEDGIIKLILKIRNDDYREKDIMDTNIPTEYTNLYKKCWSRDSLARPSIQEIYEKLLKIRN